MFSLYLDFYTSTGPDTQQLFLTRVCMNKRKSTFSTTRTILLLQFSKFLWIPRRAGCDISVNNQEWNTWMLSRGHLRRLPARIDFRDPENPFAEIMLLSEQDLHKLGLSSHDSSPGISFPIQIPTVIYFWNCHTRCHRLDLTLGSPASSSWVLDYRYVLAGMAFKCDFFITF